MLPIIASENTKGMSLFAGLSEHEKDSLIKAGRIRSVARGQLLFAHGDPVAQFFLVIRGTVQLFRTAPDGHEKTVAIVKSSQTLCEDEILDACRGHRASAVAVEDVAVMEFPASWLKDAAKNYSAFALNLLSQMAERAHIAEVEAEHQATMSAAQLVACFMQRLCVLYNFDPQGFDLPYSKTLIASRLGMELETFSRTLHKLREHGIVVEGNHVRITDLLKISEYVCGMCSISGDCTTHQTLEQDFSLRSKTKCR